MKEEMLNMNCAKALATSVENREGENTVRSEVDDIYTPLEEAKEEIWRRWNDKALRKKVEDFLGGDIPSVFKEAPRAVLSRHVLSPNFEMLRFFDLVGNIGLRPLGLEYTQDKFITKNKDKYHLGKLFIYEGLGKHSGAKIAHFKVTDICLNDGKKFSEMKTFWGSDFVDFHHSIVHSLIPSEDIVDMSDYYRRNGGVASSYYGYIISLFICHGVLFENYLLCGNYSELTKKVFLPNFRKIWETFEVKPLVVRLVPAEEECSVHWRYYPKVVRTRIDAIMKRVDI